MYAIYSTRDFRCPVFKNTLGSEIRTSLDFKWPKRSWVASCQNFKWNLKSGGLTVFGHGTGHLNTKALKYRTKKSAADFDNLPEANVVEAVTDFLDLGVPFEGDPTAPEPASFRLRVRDCRPQETRIPLAHGFNLSLGDSGGQVPQEDGGGSVQGTRFVVSLHFFNFLVLTLLSVALGLLLVAVLFRFFFRFWVRWRHWGFAVFLFSTVVLSLAYKKSDFSKWCYEFEVRNAFYTRNAISTNDTFCVLAVCTNII